MQIETLKIFCDLIETKSFSKAAQLNFLTQSAVSQQIKQLEDRFQTKLVERGVRTLRPTESGEQFYVGCKDILQRFYEVESQLLARTTVVTGMVKVAVVYSVGLYVLPEYMRRFLGTYAQVNIHIEYLRTNRVYEDLIANVIDLGIVAYPVRRPGIEVLPFTKDHLVGICKPGHPLTRMADPDIRAFKDFPFIGFDRDIPTRRAVDRAFKAHGINVLPRMEFDNIETIKGAVEIDLGVSIVPEPCVQREAAAGTLAVIPLDDHELTRTIGLVYRRNKTFTTAAQKFAEVLTGRPHPLGARRTDADGDYDEPAG